MECIKDGDHVSLQLKDVELENPQEVFDEIVQMMKRLFKIGLIHGDLSDFNILMQNGRPVFIDFSQGSSIEAYNAKDLLMRDIKNICNFFSRKGLDIDEKVIFKEITGKVFK